MSGGRGESDELRETSFSDGVGGLSMDGISAEQKEMIENPSQNDEDGVDLEEWGASVELPPPWERHWADEEGAWFFFNPMTRECMWAADLAAMATEEGVEQGEDDEGVTQEDFEQPVDEEEIQNIRSQFANMDLDVLMKSNDGVEGSAADRAALSALEALASPEDGQNVHQDQKISSPSVSMPPPWQSHWVESEGEWFFHNPITGEKLWEEEAAQRVQQYGIDEAEDDDIPPPPPDSPTADGGIVVSKKEVVDSTQVSTPERPSEEKNLTLQASPCASVVSGKDVVERSENMLRMKAAKIEAAQAAAQAAEASEIRDPKITRKSASMNRSVEDMFAWEEKRRQKLAAAAEAAAAAETGDVTGKPKVTAYANRLAAKARESEVDDNGSDYGGDLMSLAGQTTMTQSTAFGGSVADRLMAYEERRAHRVAEKKAEADREAREAAHPKLTRRTEQLALQKRAQEAALYGDDYDVYNQGSVCGGASVTDSSAATDRLYALSRLRQETHGGVLPQGRLQQHDERTGQRLFEPQINQTSRAMAERNRGAVPVEVLLTQKGQAYQRKQAIRAWRQAESARAMSERPQINPTSERIAMTSGVTRKPLTARLAKPIGAVRAKTIDEVSTSRNFRPQISRGSQEIIAQNGGRYRYGGEISNTTGDRGSDSDSLLLNHWDELSQMETGEAVCVDDIRSLSGRSAGGGPKSSTIMYERTCSWDSERRKRIEAQQAQKDKELMENCSFKPRISSLSQKLGGGVTTTTASAADLPDRHAAWAKQREEKLERERRLKEEASERELTFIPAVPSRSGSRAKVRDVRRSSAEDLPPPPPPPPNSVAVTVTPSTYSMDSWGANGAISGYEYASSLPKEVSSVAVTSSPSDYQYPREAVESAVAMSLYQDAVNASYPYPPGNAPNLAGMPSIAVPVPGTAYPGSSLSSLSVVSSIADSSVARPKRISPMAVASLRMATAAAITQQNSQNTSEHFQFQDPDDPTKRSLPNFHGNQSIKVNSTQIPSADFDFRHSRGEDGTQTRSVQQSFISAQHEQAQLQEYAMRRTVPNSNEDYNNYAQHPYAQQQSSFYSGDSQATSQQAVYDGVSGYYQQQHHSTPYPAQSYNQQSLYGMSHGHEVSSFSHTQSSQYNKATDLRNAAADFSQRIKATASQVRQSRPSPLVYQPSDNHVPATMGNTNSAVGQFMSFNQSLNPFEDDELSNAVELDF